MTMMRIRLELARHPDFPNGSRERGYEFVAPLDDSGHLQADEWRKNRDQCRARRFWPGTKDEIGHLIHRRGGSWAFDYNPKTSDDDEPGFKFNDHRFVLGEYVSIREHDGEMRTFLVASVRELD